MKQGEQKARPIGTGAATIRELSNDSTRTPIPQLTVMLPAETIIHNRGYSDAHQMNLPAQSLQLTGENVRQLYNFLQDYYA